tara:strand:- start:7322 stop:7609 length:288 start_codon:yes stop_codon:yes gene_type:complete
MKLKLDSGREVKLKDVSLDDRDLMLDKVEYQFKEDGTPNGVKMMHSTITFWLRKGLDGDTSDNFIKELSFEERTEIFLKMQDTLLLGEGKPSNSK